MENSRMNPAGKPQARSSQGLADPSVPGPRLLRAGMVGMGMIFDETYRPFFERTRGHGLYDRSFGDVDVRLTAVASRTGMRADKYLQAAPDLRGHVKNLSGPDAVASLVGSEIDFACVATPDDRHFDSARTLLQAGIHVLIEKPSVLRLDELDELLALVRQKDVLAKVVYHKLLDPDHKKGPHARRGRRFATRQQRLLLAVGAQADFRPAILRVDSGA